MFCYIFGISLVLITVNGQVDFQDALGLPRPGRRGVLRAGAIVPFGSRHDFWTWPDKTVLYYFDSGFTSEEQDHVRKAMEVVKQNLTDCISFKEVDKSHSKFKIKITLTDEDTKAPAVACKSWPGILKTRMAKFKEQPLTLARGYHGCIGEKTPGVKHPLRPVMKMMVVILGRRNEHQRNDRDSYISVNMANIQPGLELAYRQHPSENFIYVCNYDYCSITHNSPTDFGVQGTVMFAVKNPPYFIPELDSLSGCDCKEIVELYRCPTSNLCKFFDCEAQKPPPNAIISIPAGPQK